MKQRSLVLTSRDFLIFILGSYAVVVFVFVDGGLRNYLVLFAAVLGGLMFFVFRLPLQRQVFLAFFLFSYMGSRAFLIGGAQELGSVAFTFIYALGYFAIVGLLERVYDQRAFVMWMLRSIIYAFMILSVIQMATSLVGLPIPNLGATKGLWSYNSFSYEPAHLGRVVGISMLCYIMVARLPVLPGHSDDLPRTRNKVLLAYLTTMLLSGSALAFMAIIVVFVLSRSLAWVTALTATSFLIWPLVLVIDFEPLQRVVAILTNLGSLDVDTLFAAEASGASRIAPTLIYLQEISTEDAGFWFGYGSDGLRNLFLGRMPGFGDIIAAGFLPGFAVVYGALIFGFFIWIFLLRLANGTTAPLICFWLVFMTSSAWNTQVFWYGLILVQIAWAVNHERLKPTSRMSS